MSDGDGTLDEQLLAGPVDHERAEEAAWLDEIHAEIAAAFAALEGLGPAITFFGSARTPEHDPGYQLARETAKRFGEAGYSIITGAGPGIMEAANRGAREAGVTSVGLNIELPQEQFPNAYIDIELNFAHFFARKLIFVRYAAGFVLFPGGYGTLDELAEALTLMQTGKIDHFPVVLMGLDGWRGLTDWINTGLVESGRITKADAELLHLTDDPAEALAVAERENRARRPTAG